MHKLESGNTVSWEVMELMRLELLLSWLLLGVTVVSTSTLNQRPVIGVMTQQVEDGSKFYMAASYVKFLECAGARVLPIIGNSTEEELTVVFKAINGLLFPGGGLYFNTSYYGRVGSLFYQWAKKANDEGDYFPLWGTCLGFEFLNYLQAGQDYSVLAYVDAEKISLPVSFTEAANSSRLFSGFSSDQMEWMASENVTFNNHHRGVTLSTFTSRADLSQFYTVLGTSKDRKGTEFVAVMEGKKYPFYGVQWHPEKNGFEWTLKEPISHTQHAVMDMQMMANFFVSEARRSRHVHSTSTSTSSNPHLLDLIYAYKPTYTNTGFEQVYYF